ncbi:MAG: ATP-binding cassette domain-containing protein [Actinomycetota bacterium]|nr:ATP-binding cassette domain-containing protein [Actinomycetota bacterium]
MPPAGGPGVDLFTLEAVVVEIGGRRVVDDLTDHIHEGHATALVGPSGSGKTTVLRLLNRLAEPTSGRVLFRGQDVRDLDVHDLRRRVGLLGQQPVMLSTTIGEEVRVGRPDLSDDEVGGLLERVGLGHFRRERPTAGLSGGEQQRLALARALAVEPEVLLLDEPTSALDPAAARAVDRVVRALVRGGLSVVLVSHDQERAAALADDALVLDQGRLVERGDPRTVRYLTERSEDL